MPDPSAFESVCGQLEARTPLSALEARGTVRLALKQAGFDARSVTAPQLQVVVRKVLPAELRLRGIDDADSVCEHLAAGLEGDACAREGDTPEDVFARLAGEPA